MSGYLFDDVNLDSPMDADRGVKDVVIPSITPSSPEWHDYVMSQFEEDELCDGKPVNHGLNRVARTVLGPIISSKPVQVFPPVGDTVGRATVVWEIIFQSGITFGDVADCWEGNTEDKFVVFATATAATRAESRALRKALCLKTVAAEELTEKNPAETLKKSGIVKSTEGEYDGSQRMNDTQANFIDVKCKQLDIDVSKFFQEVFSVNIKKKVTMEQAGGAIEQLNQYQGNKGLIPDCVMGYGGDWRTG